MASHQHAVLVAAARCLLASSLLEIVSAATVQLVLLNKLSLARYEYCSKLAGEGSADVTSLGHGFQSPLLCAVTVSSALSHAGLAERGTRKHVRLRKVEEVRDAVLVDELLRGGNCWH